MREIKFRLRDRHNKIVGYEKWHEGCWHPDNPNKGFSLDSGYWEAQPCWLYSIDGDRWTPEPIHHRRKDLFTGLHDKNGKEIFEGDIVRISWTSYAAQYEEVVREVKWNGNGYGNVFDEGNSPKYAIEVIGNVFENGDLINGKQ